MNKAEFLWEGQPNVRVVEAFHAVRGRPVPVAWLRDGVLRWIVNTPKQQFREVYGGSKDLVAMKRIWFQVIKIQVWHRPNGVLYSITRDRFHEHEQQINEGHGRQVVVEWIHWDVEQVSDPQAQQFAFELEA